MTVLLTLLNENSLPAIVVARSLIDLRSLSLAMLLSLAVAAIASSEQRSPYQTEGCIAGAMFASAVA